ncbi:MAG: replication initiator protein A [Lactobacillus helveticus]
MSTPNSKMEFHKLFFHNPKYKKLSTDARYLYMIFTLKMTKSPNNGWVDSDGNMYIIYPDKDLMDV